MQLFDNPLELVIFDVDGVLLDILRSLRQVFEATARELQLNMKPLVKFLDELDADPTILSPDIALDAERIWPWMNREKAVAFAWKFQEQRMKNPFPQLKHSAATLYALRLLKIPMALCTTNDLRTLKHQLANSGIKEEWFAAMSTWECGFCKPDSRVLDTIFEQVPVRREWAVFLGDRFGDLEAARGGKVRFMPVLSGGISRETFLEQGVPEDHILEHVGEFLDRIKF